MWLTRHLAFDARLAKGKFGCFIKGDIHHLSHSGKVSYRGFVQMTKLSMPDKEICLGALL